MGPDENIVDVLFVEDSAGDALLTGQILAESLQQVKLHIARDGLQAMQILSDPAFQPALIILDLRLPILSGHVVLERNQRPEIPIVVFSASWNQDDVSRAMAHGAREYVQSPSMCRRTAMPCWEWSKNGPCPTTMRPKLPGSQAALFFLLNRVNSLVSEYLVAVQPWA